MGIETILKSITKMNDVQDSGMDVSKAVAIPETEADPLAVENFADRMQQRVNTENNIGDRSVLQNPEAVLAENRLQLHQAMIDNNTSLPVTLGEKLTAARMNRGEESRTKELLNVVADMFEKDAISHSDLYRIQVLASMSKLEVIQNSSFSKGMDAGLKTLLKNS